MLNLEKQCLVHLNVVCRRMHTQPADANQLRVIREEHYDEWLLQA